MTMDLDWTGKDPDDLAEKLDRFGPELQKRLERVLDEAVLRVQANAARLAPVDTGRLRSSIEGVVEQLAGDILEGVVGTNVEYARYQESMQPFLRPAMESIWPWLRREVMNAVEAAWGAA